MGLLRDDPGHAVQQSPGAVLGTARHPQLKLVGCLRIQLKWATGCCLQLQHLQPSPRMLDRRPRSCQPPPASMIQT